MGKIITKEIRLKLQPLIESEESNNWYLALCLLKSLGLNDNSAERWLYKQLYKLYNRTTVKNIYNVNKFIKDNFKINYQKLKFGPGMRHFINYDNYGIYGGINFRDKFDELLKEEADNFFKVIKIEEK